MIVRVLPYFLQVQLYCRSRSKVVQVHHRLSLAGMFSCIILSTAVPVGAVHCDTLFKDTGGADGRRHTHIYRLPKSEELDILLAIYFYSKAWELTIWSSSLSWVCGQIFTLIFMVHHTTTPILAWLIWKFRPASGGLFLLLNVVMHAVLYAYFGGARQAAVGHFLRFWGHIDIQLVVGIFA